MSTLYRVRVYLRGWRMAWDVGLERQFRRRHVILPGGRGTVEAVPTDRIRAWVRAGRRDVPITPWLPASAWTLR